MHSFFSFVVHSRLSIVVVTVNSDDCKNVSSISFFQDLFLLLYTQGSNHFSDTAKLRAGTKKSNRRVQSSPRGMLNSLLWRNAARLYKRA